MTHRRGNAAAVTGQRRVLTVMFCDLAASTHLSELLDPEDYAEIVLEYHELGRTAVEEFGGTVTQYVGDGLVCHFGFPTAHEDDAERCIEAAFAIVDRLGGLSARYRHLLPSPLQVRIGVHAALTVVGRMGAQSRTDTSLFGTTANVASRVQASAELGEIVATESIIRALRGRYAVRGLRSVTLRGMADPIEIGVLERRVMREHGVLPSGPVHGRGSERSWLRDRWNRVEPDGGGVVVIVGAAGLGKSTLVRWLAGECRIVDVIEVRAREFAALSPFSLLSDLARAVAARGDEQAVRAANGVLAAVFATVDRSTISAEQAWQLVIEAAQSLARELGRRSRLVVLEDIHWIDPSSHAALDAMAPLFAGTACLVVATSRPPTAVPGADELRIEVLHDDALRTLIEETLGASGADRATRDLLLERSAGVPLYAAELCRDYLDRGGIDVPESLQAALLARIDRHPELSRFAHVASVLGDGFDTRLFADLADLAGQAATLERADIGQVETAEGVLRRLVAVDILQPAPGGGWSFTHALVREAVYQAMLQRDRRELHAASAQALARHGARNDGRSAVVARHWELAGEAVPASEEYAHAARRSALQGSVAEALVLAQRGLALLDEPSQHASLALHLSMTLGNARLAAEGYSAPGLLAVWESAEALAIAADDHGERSSAMNGQSVAALFDGEYVLAIERAERIQRFGIERRDRAALVRAHCSLAVPQLYLGRVADSLANCEQALECYRPGDDQMLTYGFGTDHGVIALATAGFAAFLADDDRSASFLTRAVDLGGEIASPISSCLALNQALTVDLLAGRHDAALAIADRLETLAERFALPFYVSLARLGRGVGLAGIGEPGALAMATVAIDQLGAGGSRLALTLGVLQLAQAQASLGDVTEAAGMARFGMLLAAQSGEAIVETELAVLAATCSGDSADWVQAELFAAHAEVRGALGSARRARDAMRRAGVL